MRRSVQPVILKTHWGAARWLRQAATGVPISFEQLAIQMAQARLDLKRDALMKQEITRSR